jgi:CBS domain-containing protein
MTVRDILRSKGVNVITIAPDASVLEAMRVLVHHNIGALVVVDGSIRGIVTERDMLRAGAEDPNRLVTARVSELMTPTVITATAAASVEEVMNIMTENRIRHLPIQQDGVLGGIVSIGDVVNAMRQTTETENRYLHAYIAGVPT